MSIAAIEKFGLNLLCDLSMILAFQLVSPKWESSLLREAEDGLKELILGNISLLFEY